MTIPTQITDHVTAGLARLLGQFQESTRLKGLITAFIGGYQDLEDVGFELLLDRWIDTAEGEQLDGLGSIVGQPRGGMVDAAYRIRIYGKIAQNTSEGTAGNLTSIYNLLTGTARCHMFESFPAEVYIMGGAPDTILPQLIDDSDMEAVGVTDWTAVNSATLTKSLVAPNEGLQSLRIAYNAVNDPGALQAKLTIGKAYWINGYVKMEDTGGEVPEIKDGAVTIYTGFPYDDWYEFDIIRVATSTNLTIGTDHAVAGWGEFDNVTVYELDTTYDTEVFEICDLVLAGGVRLIGAGWFIDGEAFSFAGDPLGLGFSSILDPSGGGKFAGLTATP